MINRLFNKLNFFRHISIQNKIVITFSFLIINTILIISLIVINKYSKSVEENTSIYSYQIIDQVIKNIDFYIKEVENVSAITNYNYYIQKYLKNKNQSGELDRTNNINQSIALLRDIGNLRQDVMSTFIIGNDGSVLSNKDNIQIDKNYNFINQEWFISAKENKDTAIIVNPHKQNYIMGSDDWVISLSRCIRSYDDDSPIGVLLIDLDLNVLDDICSNVKPGKNGYIFLIDSNGNVVYHPDYSYIYSLMNASSIFSREDNFIPSVLESKEGSFIRNINSEKQHITFKPYNAAGWTIISITPYDDMLKEINNMKQFLIFVGLVCLLCIFAMSILIASMITKPIKKLELLMEEAEKGNLEVSLDFKSEDEIGKLSYRFNIMINKIKALMDQVVKEQEAKRKSELKALQAQINPHFLYNTLDSIIWMAEVNSSDVILMTDALAKLFRISLSKGQEIIPVKHEIEHVRNYLIIQSMRYTNKFDYKINVDREVLNYNTLKLILQPLVENSIYHGIKTKRQKGFIEINAKLIEDKILFEVIDDGIGMEQSKCEEILSKYDNSPNTNGFNGVGTRNVNERIKLYYGQEYGLKFTSKPGVGTKVQIFLPIL
jgi:two-component system sensor histidine kinase YesM